MTPDNANDTWEARSEEHLELARKCAWIFVVLSAVTLATLIAVAAFGDLSNTFMWVRGPRAVLVATRTARWRSDGLNTCTHGYT
jgi:hypothetical protein